MWCYIIYCFLDSFFGGGGGGKCRSRFLFFLGGGGCFKHKGFSEVSIFAPIRSSLSLEIRITSPPLPPRDVTKTRNEHEERENKKWEKKNLISTLAFSVTWFQNLCFVRTFHFPIPLCSFPALRSPFSNIPVLCRHVRPRRTTAKFYVLWRT